MRSKTRLLVVIMICLRHLVCVCEGEARSNFCAVKVVFNNSETSLSSTAICRTCHQNGITRKVYRKCIGTEYRQVGNSTAVLPTGGGAFENQDLISSAGISGSIIPNTHRKGECKRDDKFVLRSRLQEIYCIKGGLKSCEINSYCAPSRPAARDLRQVGSESGLE